MNTARARFVAAAAALGLDVEPVTYPAGTRTAADAAAAIGCSVDQIVKSLVFVTTGAGGEVPVLALTSGGSRVDPAALAVAVGADAARIATADEVRAATGFAIGGTPPFGHTSTITTVVDPHLLTFDSVWAAAGTPTDVVALHPRDLVAAGALVVDDFTT